MINDVFHATKIPIVCCADDSTIIAEAETPETLLLSVNKAMNDMSKWMCANSLKLNVQKLTIPAFKTEDP